MGVTCRPSGRLLRINLRDRSIRVEELSWKVLRYHLGGEGIGAWILLREVPRGADPLGEENKLVFAIGPLTGSSLPGFSRVSVVAKSPLTGGFGCAEAGGYWPAELAKAGWDGVVFEGRSETPVWVSIRDNDVRIHDACELQGLAPAEVQERVRRALQDDRARVCAIGVGGENLVPFACIAFDVTHFAGRTGLGAVMAAKGLKAVAVRGTNRIAAADEDRVAVLRKRVLDAVQGVRMLRELGTAWLVQPLNLLGGLPTRNFREGSFEGAEALSGEVLRDSYLLKRESCFGCPVACKRVVRVDGRFKVDPRNGGPEYEAIAALGSCCGVSELDVVCRANELCNIYGLDVISTGAVIAFAMECFEQGALTKEDTGGMDVSFGCAEAVLGLIEQVAKRSGPLGPLLSKGVRAAAAELGVADAEFTLHIKGQELPMHEPRLKPGMGIGYAVSPTGADHIHNVHDTNVSENVSGLFSLGVMEPVPVHDLSHRKVRLLKQHSTWRHAVNSLVQCIHVPWRASDIVEALRSVCGWDTGVLDLFYVGERAVNMARIFNIREGIGGDTDRLPARFTRPFTSGPLAGRRLDAQEVGRAIADYYQMMGWTGEGVPTHGKLKELDIAWILDSHE